MKQMLGVACVLTLLVVGCMAMPQVAMYAQAYPARGPDDRIDVYQTSLPDRQYVEIALITCGDTDDSWNMRQILMKAREMGADGIIITGRSGSYGIGAPVGGMTYAVAEGYGIRAVAIKYR